jgi:hypothetical protein
MYTRTEHLLRKNKKKFSKISALVYTRISTLELRPKPSIFVGVMLTRRERETDRDTDIQTDRDRHTLSTLESWCGGLNLPCSWEWCARHHGDWANSCVSIGTRNVLHIKKKYVRGSGTPFITKTGRLVACL